MIELLRLGVLVEADVFLLRQRGREVAAAVGLDAQDQVRVATALSEVGREVLAVGGGEARLGVRGGNGDDALVVELSARPELPAASPGTLTGLTAAQRLMDDVSVTRSEARARVRMSKNVPVHRRAALAADLPHLRAQLAATMAASPLDELRAQNTELAAALEQVQGKQAELLRLNAELMETNRGVMAMYAQLSAELEETNRGVVALYAELDEQGRELQRANESKSRFLADVSHELRTPITSVLGLAGLLAADTDRLDAEQRRQVGYIRSSARDLLALVNELLDLAKAESGRLEPTIGPVDVAVLLATLRGTLRPLAVDPDVALVIEEPPPVAGLWSDADLLRHVLRNLVTNALRFTERGRVRLTTTVDEAARLLHFAVGDTGIGIAPEDQSKIFEEFYQVPGPLQARSKGTGLGLPYARRVVELLGGRLELTSAPGEGSVFTVTLPLRTGTADATEPARPASPAARRRSAVVGSVLVVDDDESYRLLLRGMLAGMAGEVLEARTGVEAMETLTARRPDVVLLDLRMPAMGGVELLGRMARDPGLRDLPVIVVTGVELDGTTLTGTGRARAVVPKSALTPDRLRELLARHARGST